MSAAMPVRATLTQEGAEYWANLIRECERQARAINAVASGHGYPADSLIECRSGSTLHLYNSHCPSTSVKVTITYWSWGPMLDGIVTGQEDDSQEFCPEEFTLPIARDLDGSAVAVYEEGRSFSAHELATYLMQNFRRCFPGVSLPCEQPAA